MNIFIVDTNRQFVDSLAGYLRKENDVEKAYDYQDALFMLREYSYDAILIGIGEKENVSALDMLRIIRTSHVLSFIIIFGEAASIETIVEYMKYGANDFIDKSLLQQEFIEEVRRTLQRDYYEYRRNRAKKRDGELKKQKLLLIDDNVDFTDAILEFLADEYEITVINDFALARENILRYKEEYACIFIDVRDESRMSNDAGLALFREYNTKGGKTPVVMLSIHAEPSLAVSSLKNGAKDFLEKSINIRETVEKMRSVMLTIDDETRKPQQEHLSAVGAQYRLIDIVGSSQPMWKVRKQILQVAADDIPVLIYGDTGTGKEMIASALHVASERKDNRFIAVNCSSIPEDIFESEMFGHKKGSFTGAVDTKQGKIELAHNGTLFLDEIESLPISQQVKLLRVLEAKTMWQVGGREEKRVNFRLICATNIPLADLVAKGVFRKDLFFRISSFTIRLPSLTERGRNEIALLASCFADEGKGATITDDAYELLATHHWGGNVRELKNVISAAKILAPKKGGTATITREVLEDSFKEAWAFSSLERTRHDHAPESLEDLVKRYDYNLASLFRDLEDIAVPVVYRESNGNLSKTANRLFRESATDKRDHRTRVKRILERNAIGDAL